MTRIWDLPLRLYHWLQALLVLLLLVTGFSGAGASLLHQAAGVLLLLLLIWRLLWGLCGSETARFRQFVPAPRTLLRYLRGGSVQYVGHSPAGAVMVVVMISLLLLQTGTGLLLCEWIDSTVFLGRSLVRRAEALHEMNAALLAGMIVVHITAVVGFALQGRPLIRAMVTGQAPGNSGPLQLASNRSATLLLLLSLSLLTLVISGLMFLEF